ncbi:heavy metal transporter [Halorubrum sp. CBA1125]|uniref:heavy-metal-associated domain-containing protein n=1 Tax=Halorubrum sp. CBA1125 TaxID=2668072 RepID=UPI0012E75B51|nr:heavy metal-associated domain-containing protein [Halorubrum sp. CBA1125]MUW14254.1 heavy metal transporter [Halorubrum sp. CBA1125]
MTTLEVDGMACDGCEEAVIDAIEGVPGAESATADHEAGVATVEGDVDVDAVVAAIEEAGYEATP